MLRMKAELSKNEEKQKHQEALQLANQQLQDETQAQGIEPQPTQKTTDVKQQLQQQRSNHSNNNDQQQDVSNNRPKRNPFCSRCRNHGKSAQVKGHKRYCEYRECQCLGCKLVEDRQAVSAKQIKLRRYQKQDEECGRRIEITPPVLSRDATGGESAALLAKTLIGSVSEVKNIHLQQQQQVTTAAAVAAAAVAQKQMNNHQIHHEQQQQQHHHHHHHLGSHLSGIHSASLATAAAVASSSSATPTTNHHHVSQQQLQQHQPHSNHGVQLHDSHLNLNLGQQQHQQTAALTNALQLFHYPKSMLSAAAAAVAGINPAPPAPSASSATSAASNAKTNTNTSPLPNLRDQFTLVEEIYKEFGPLAIYAWLKAEHFDLHKVRDLIESSRASFNDMMDLKTKYFSNKSSLENNHTGELGLGLSDRVIMRVNQTNDELSNGTSPTDKVTAPILDVISNSSTATTLSSSPLYTLGNSYASNYLNNGNDATFNNPGLRHQFHNSANFTTVTAPTSHLPMATAQSFFWPDLKLATSGHGSMIHPHHLLPHFMQHHPFITHQNKHTQAKVSPVSTITQSPPSESSSSTIM